MLTRAPITREELIALGLAAGYNDIVAVARADKYLETLETFYGWVAFWRINNE